MSNASRFFVRWMPNASRQSHLEISFSVAKQLQKRHVNTCIQGLVKTVIFRKCKFITSKAYYNKVMAVVIGSKKPADPPKLVRLLYKMCVFGSLNLKRSSCQKVASNCVKVLLKAKQHRSKVDPPPYSIDMPCKLCQAQTPEEKWPSFGSQIHCWNVCVGKQRGCQEEVSIKNIRCQVRQHQQEHQSPFLMRHLHH